MDKQEFKTRWESDDNGGGITHEDVAACAKAWGLSAMPYTVQMDDLLYTVLVAAGTNDAEEFRFDYEVE